MSKPSYNCKKCPGFCCSYALIEISDKDIQRLADHHQISYKEAEKRFTKEVRDEDNKKDIRVLRHHKDDIFTSICLFFDRDKRRCTVYHARPAVCRGYPYGNKCGYYDFLKFERAHQDDDTAVIGVRNDV